jgi:hypothetical protein
MIRPVLLVALFLTLPSAASAGPKEEAEASVQKFVTSFNAANNLDEIVGMFSPDAQFWGTISPELGVTPDDIRKYFSANFSTRATAPLVASVGAHSVNALSDDVVLIAGRWQVERGGKTIDLRFSSVLSKRGGRWLITQFHSSLSPDT